MKPQRNCVSTTSSAIDRFGLGFKSVEKLHELPVVGLKIKNSFVGGCADDPNSLAICRSVIDLAHRLGVGVVAEGIDRAQDFELLAKLDCDMGQGSLFGKPVSKETL